MEHVANILDSVIAVSSTLVIVYVGYESIANIVENIRHIQAKGISNSLYDRYSSRCSP